MINISCNISNLIGYSQTNPMSQSLANEMSKGLGRDVVVGKSGKASSIADMWRQV